MECLVCKRKGEKTFNINFLCGDAQYTVKDDLTEFLGSGIEQHLKPEDVVCNICMNMLDDIAKIKRKLWDIILTPRKSTYPIKLGKSWDFFAKSARNQFEESDFDDPLPSSLTPLSVTSTPSQFWSISHSKEYNQELEERCARREMVKRQRSQSKSSIKSASSCGNDEEVAKLFRGKGRRGRPKSVGGLPKIITKKLRRVQSEADRCNSSLSELSCISYTKHKKDFRPKTPKLIYGKDKQLIRPRTRSISRMLFYCSVCFEDKKNLEMYTAHMIVLHNRKACFGCLDCGVNLLTAEHLEMHQRIHRDTVLCTICGENYEDIVTLKKHTDRHFRYSVPCSYCDLSFLSEYECSMHSFNHHRGRKRKLRDKTQYKIEEIVTYVDSDKTANKEPWDSNYSTKKYTASSMILNIRKKSKVHQPSFDELDYRVRHPEPVIGYNLTRDKSSSNARSSDSPSFMFTYSDTDDRLSDSSTSESVSHRKRRFSRRWERSTNRDKNLSPPDGSPLDSLSEKSYTFNVDDRLSPHKSIAEFRSYSRSTYRAKNLSPPDVSPLDSLSGKSDTFNADDRLSPQKSISEFRSESVTLGEESDNSEQSSIQTEMHYLVDGKTLHTNVDLAAIVNINGSSSSSESNRYGEGVDPDITND